MRLLSLSRTGRHVVVRHPEGLERVDALGTAPRVRVPGGRDFACIGTALWVLSDDGMRIDRHALADGRKCAPIALPAPASCLVEDRAGTAVIAGSALVADDTVLDTGAARVFPIGGHRVAIVDDACVRIVEVGRRAPVVATLAIAGVAEVFALYAGKLVCLRACAPDGDTWTVVRPDGTRVHRIAVPRAICRAVASEAGVAIALAGGEFHWLDLRHGVVRATGDAPFAATTVDLSVDAQFAAFACSEADGPRVVHVATVALLSGSQRAVVAEAEPEPEPVAAEPEPDDDVICSCDPVTPVAAPAVIDHVVPRAFGDVALVPAAQPTDWPAYRSASEHLDDLMDLVAARVGRAIASGWHAGRLAYGGERSASRELQALLGLPGAHAPDELRRADQLVVAAVARTAGRTRSTLAAGTRLPLVDVMHELALSPIAGHVLAIAIAAAERAEVVRMLRILGDDRQRAVLDRALVEAILGGDDRVQCAAVAAELAPGAPLRRHGALHVDGNAALAAITVDPAVIERCRGRCLAPPPARSLAELCIAPDALRELIAATATVGRDPLRLVVRGRRGSGRRTAIAALAARVGRAIADVDCARLARSGTAMAAALAVELRRAVLRGAVPVVSGLELADAADGEGQDRIREVLRAHAGPVVVRTAPESHLPIDPGFTTVTLPALTERERAAYWRTALARAGIAGESPDELAARWRIAPGQIEDVIARACDGARVDAVARQHVARRLAHVATPVRRLPAWEQVALPDEMIDSIREFIGRVSHRRTVFDDWGFDGKLTSARGLTALFYGPPGTGKTMVAGLIARELGLELYRVDLSRVVSKWIGETEKNLGEVFDAAEDGQVVIVFDEADSLFAKRTEVKTSNDRYANLEVNYLLQRLDTFEGVAILTTNLDGSIDPAFKRRMSMRLAFPFPDEDIRKRLWAAHIPRTTPTANDFNFDELARRFQLSGGYIRNSALRAAFIAAQEHRPLAHEHLLRAIALEYRELGKLATDGRLE